MKMFRSTLAGLALALALSCYPSEAQTPNVGIGGNASLSVGTSSANVAIPANRTTFPALLIAPSASSSQEIFYALGNSGVTATTSGPALPTGGICINAGPNTNVAAIVAAGSATLRITQLSACASFAAAGAGGGGGGGSVTQGTVPWVDSITLWGGVTLGAPSSYGTSPGAVAVPGVNSFITNIPHVICDSGCSSSTAPADESAFTAGTTPQSPVGGFFQTTATNNALTTGQMGAFQVTANRALFSNLRNASGAEIGIAAAPLRVDPTGSTTQPVSGTVTANAGTNLNTSALALEAGNLATLAGTVSTARIAVNPISGQAGVQGGAGASTALTQRMAIATDANAVAATLSAETTKVIGTVNVSAGQSIAVTNAGTFAVQVSALALAQGSTTSGQTGPLVQGAVTTAAPGYTTAQTSPLSLTTAGDLRTVFSNTSIGVTQGTASSLNATVVGTGTFAVQASATQSGTWNITNVSGTVSLPTGASTAANQTAVQTPITPATATATVGWLFGGQYNSTQATFTNGQQGAVQISSRGEIKSNLMDAAGNARGANVNASNQLSVSVDNTVTVASHAVTNAGTFAVQAAQSGTWNITNVSGTVSLPTGASTAANQTTGQTPITPATATATVGNLMAMQYNTTQATFTNGQQGSVQGSSRGALYVATGADAFTVTGAGGTFPVTQSTSPWIVAGGGTAGSAATGVVTVQGIASMTKLLVTPDSVALPANQSVNVAQINGVTPLMGNGVTGTGSPRVTIASDNTAFSVNATLSAETTKVIGTVNIAAAQTIATTNAGTFAVQPASATVPVSTMNSASANSGVNSAMAGVFDDAVPTSITENNFGFLRMSANRNLYGTIRDAGGNERGANVNPSGQLSVAIDNTAVVTASSATAPVSTMNSASANSGVNSAMAAVFDDASPTAITENSFGFVRMSANRNQYTTLRDAAGNERGQNVNANNAALVAIDQTTSGANVVVGAGTTNASSITRPADTNVYTANDALANSTTVPTAGGFTVTGACRTSGGMGMITNAMMLMSTAAATSLQGEIWLFDQAVTAINDNAAFSVSDGDMAFFIGKIPFTTSDGATNNASATVAGVNIAYTCVGTANLRYLVKVINAYTPASAEVLTFKPSVIYLN